MEPRPPEGRRPELSREAQEFGQKASQIAQEVKNIFGEDFHSLSTRLSNAPHGRNLRYRDIIFSPEQAQTPSTEEYTGPRRVHFRGYKPEAVIRGIVVASDPKPSGVLRKSTTDVLIEREDGTGVDVVEMDDREATFALENALALWTRDSNHNLLTDLPIVHAAFHKELGRLSREHRDRYKTNPPIIGTPESKIMESLPIRRHGWSRGN